MNCAICNKPLDTSDPLNLNFNDDGFILCQACAHHGGGIVLEDDDQYEANDENLYGFSGDWWKNEQ